MAETYLSLAERVQLIVPNCPIFAIADEIKESAIRFFEDSEAWVHSEQQQTSDPEVVLVPPVDTAVSHIRNVRLNGVPLTAVSQQTAEIDKRDRFGKPVRFYADFKTITLNPAPTTELTVDITYTVRPSRMSLSMDSDKVEQYYEGIVHGAVAVLTGMEGRDWYNRTQSEISTALYQQALNKAKVKGQGNSSRIMKAKFRW